MKLISFNDSDAVIGSRVRKCRLDWKKTQEELASAIDVTSHYIGEIECGRRPLTLPIAEQLCLYFGTTYDYLYLGMELPTDYLLKDANSDRKKKPHNSKDLLLSFVASSTEEDCEDYLTLLSGMRRLLERKREAEKRE